MQSLHLGVNLITTTLYDGQGIGNQLWAWATLRSIAKKRNLEFGIQAPWRFKGSKYFKIDFGRRVIGISPKSPSSVKPLGIRHYYQEKTLIFNGVDISERDIDLELVPDRTKIDGVFQCEDYIYDYKSEIADLLKLEKPVGLDDSQCVIHIRGGDFKGNNDLSLKSNYYHDAMKLVMSVNEDVKFIVCTNDVSHARTILPEASVKIVSAYLESEIYSGPDGRIDNRVKVDFSFLQNAKFLITANSSFSWWGAWTNRVAEVIVAPKYWARHNLNGPVWSTGGILTRDWTYIDTKGKASTYLECADELKDKRFNG